MVVRRYIDRMLEDFAAALSQDLNVSEALAAVFGLVREVNTAIDQEQSGGTVTVSEYLAMLLLGSMSVLGVSESRRLALG